MRILSTAQYFAMNALAKWLHGKFIFEKKRQQNKSVMQCFSLSLQLIHSSVVDTAIVFPHRLGLPYKRALKNLIADHLKRIIQDNGGKMGTFSQIYFYQDQYVLRTAEKSKVRLKRSIWNMEYGKTICRNAKSCYHWTALLQMACRGHSRAAVQTFLMPSSLLHPYFTV